MIGTLLLTCSNFIPKIDVFAQVITNNSEEADVYSQMSNSLDNIEKNLNDAVQKILREARIAPRLRIVLPLWCVGQQPSTGRLGQVHQRNTNSVQKGRYRNDSRKN